MSYPFVACSSRCWLLNRAAVSSGVDARVQRALLFSRGPELPSNSTNALPLVKIIVSIAHVRCLCRALHGHTAITTKPALAVFAFPSPEPREAKYLSTLLNKTCLPASLRSRLLSLERKTHTKKRSCLPRTSPSPGRELRAKDIPLSREEVSGLVSVRDPPFLAPPGSGERAGFGCSGQMRRERAGSGAGRGRREEEEEE